MRYARPPVVTSRTVQGIAEQHQRARHLLSGQQAGHPATIGMATDHRPAQASELPSIGADGPLSFTNGQVDRTRRQTALTQAIDIGRHACRVARGAVGQHYFHRLIL